MGSTNSEIKDSSVTGQTSQGMDFRAPLLRLTRHLAVFEIYNPELVLRASEVFKDFQIVFQNRTVYAGRAVIRNLLNAGLGTVCEVTLHEGAWKDLAFSPEMVANGALRKQFGDFLEEWQKLYRVLPEYKVIIADMQSFFSDLRLSLDQVELGVKATSAANESQLEQAVAEELSQPIIPCVNVLFEKFENIADTLDAEQRPAHQNYMRRLMHPLVLCAPFANRTFHKPLGYAGDYEMVNMIARNQHEGGSLFAKVVNTWFLRQAPAEAHRNRIQYLEAMLATETLRVRRLGRPTRIFNLACGPAQEIQAFLAKNPLCEQAQLTLLDFNEETLRYLRNILDNLKHRHSRGTPIEYIKRSVHHIIKESSRSKDPASELQYDLVYCAGLFDYLSNQVCQRLMNIMYDSVAPGGLLVATNVEPSNPMRNGMEHLLDWHLIYRTAAQMRTLTPSRARAEEVCVRADATGVNVFLEVRKPDHD
ncbi:MAG: class I SAM-dependent methyltransferase [Verrucomicrobiae bacterium]|nr:class I SAM-dependent methyltransferase [Verrucomicrobiae bacterium]